MAARREEDLGGGRASWLVPFDVIIHYTKQNPRLEKEGEERRRKRERNPPPKVPPPERRREEEKDDKMECRERGGERRKKDVNGRKKTIKSY